MAKQFIVHTFSAWGYQHVSNMYAGTAQEFVNALTKDMTRWQRLEKAHEFAMQTNAVKYLSTVAALLGFYVVILMTIAGLDDVEFSTKSGGALGVLIAGIYQGRMIISKLYSHPMANSLQTYLRLPTFGEELGRAPIIKNQIETMANICLSSEKQLLFFVDDLDRCRPEAVVQTLEAVHLVMNLPNVTVIIAIDHRIALAALTQHFEQFSGDKRASHDVARDYLGKIIQLPVVLHEPSSEEMKHYIRQDLFQDCVKSDVDSEKERSQKYSSDVDEKSINEGGNSSKEGGEDIGFPVPQGEVGGKKSAVGNKAVEPSPEDSAKHHELKKIMKDSCVERDKFSEYCDFYGFRNPRQLKRLRNCYRLLKAILYQKDSSKISTDEGRFLLIRMLFALEYWAEMPSGKRDLANEENDKIKKELEGFMLNHENDALKKQVECVILPYV